MKIAVLSSLFGIALVASTLVVAGCGGSSEDTGQGATPAPGVTPTAVAQLPASSAVTLEKASAPDNDGRGELYLGDTSTGEIFRVKTQPESWISAYQWMSPTRLIVVDYYRDFYLLDLTAKTLERLPASMTEGSVTFSHSGDLMAIPGPNGDLLIWSVKDNSQVAQIAAGAVVGFTFWSPDDKHIFWPGAPSGIASVGPEPSVVAADTGEGALSAAWSSDGSSIIFSDTDGIYSIDADSGAKTLLYSWPAGVEPAPEAPKISPDGRYALVVDNSSDADSFSFRALIVPLDGSQGVQVTSTWAQDAAWSPTEDVVAVVADWCKPESRLLLLNVDGSVRSTFEGATQIPVFSTDGSTVAYVGFNQQGGTDEGLFVRSVDGDNVTAFLPGFLRDDVWSRDGRWVAYSPGSLTYQCADMAGNTEILPFP
jgi:dipeptidyl aminopeptidase/acylaminoacyl peptidase